MHRTSVLILFTTVALAQFTSQNDAVAAESYKPLPPSGMAIDPEQRANLESRVEKLQARIDQAAKRSSDAEAWVPDVEVLVRAVRLALVQDLFYKKPEVEFATQLLDEAATRLERAQQNARGLPLLGLADEVLQDPQLLVAGFRSEIDDSVQPFGLVIPGGFDPASTDVRLDVWLHGRGDTKTEVAFLRERMTKVGLYSPSQTIVLHPFGRHCNAFKFAGETDVYESIQRVGSLVDVDKTRISVRGFSMGGAGCWHFAVHDPFRWFAVNPGAGFIDTIVYQGWTEKTPYPIDTNRRQLMNWYDVLPWVTNLKNTHTVAYSGELDKQRQAADRVVTTAREHGIAFPYVIGEQMGHKINPESAQQMESILNQWSSKPREQPRQEIDFVTYSLRYCEADWIRVTGLEEHWMPSRIRGRITDERSIELSTQRITRLEVDFRDSAWPLKPYRVNVRIDGEQFSIDDWDESPGIQCEFQKVNGTWSVVDQIDSSLRKRPGLQGPIDDAFCSRFVFVAPSRPAKHGVVQRWIDKEFQYAKKRWSRLMRGEVQVVSDTEVTPEHLKNCHLVCFGDFSSNQYLRGIANQLPVTWTREKLSLGSSEFNPSTHAAAFCFPNPRNPNRYVVVNSGMTFREFSNVSNSRQIPMLADWSILDVRQPSDGIFAAKVVADGFFDEQWRVKPAE